MTVREETAKATDLALEGKLKALERVLINQAVWTEDRVAMRKKMIRGHAEHGEDVSGLDLDAERLDECWDIVGYTALDCMERDVNSLDCAIVRKALELAELVEERRLRR